MHEEQRQRYSHGLKCGELHVTFVMPKRKFSDDSHGADDHARTTVLSRLRLLLPAAVYESVAQKQCPVQDLVDLARRLENSCVAPPGVAR